MVARALFVTSEVAFLGRAPKACVVIQDSSQDLIGQCHLLAVQAPTHSVHFFFKYVVRSGASRNG